MGDALAIRAEFHTLFRREPTLYRAPGRVNLIGEHTDYNDGFVMPAALQFCTTIALAPHAAQRLRIRSREFDETVEIPLHDAADLKDSRARGHWSDYVVGVVLALRERGCQVSGADLVIGSNIPLGAGLSSSASLEVGLAFALLDSTHQTLDRLDLAQACQQAENDYVGTRCGIMDQFAATFGMRNHALALDCRSLEYRPVPLGTSMSLIVCNSLVRHSHAGGEYNQRRADCEMAVEQLGHWLPGLPSLRDVSLADLESHRQQMHPIAWRRARHVVCENRRVTQAMEALQGGDDAGFGRLMYESHRSLRDDFEVSCRELDVLVELAEHTEGVLGARMTGGGFGGCTVNWVRTEAVGHFVQSVGSRYAAAVGYSPAIYVCEIADGVSRIEDSSHDRSD